MFGLLIQLNVDDLKPGITVRGDSWPEPIIIKKVTKKVTERGVYVQIVAVNIKSNEHIDQMIQATDLGNLSIETITTDFSGDPWKIFLALESKRYRFASLYDPLLAMNTSKVDPLPHQIEAVYGYVLKMPKIRFLLAHDPGAGKTIMAGLIIKELKMRKIINRILIVVPGHLKDQWLRELKDRFSETFTVMSNSYIKSQYGENVWQKENQIITSIDFAKREENVPSLSGVEFDLVVIDEAHKMSAFQYGEKTEKTGRYKLGEILSKNSEHLLFLTATPHRGDPENFRLFLDLLNPGFFKTAAMIKESLNNGDNPLFLRRIKEDMKDFEGKPLFVPRYIKTLEIVLSDPEKELYNEVSIYVKEQYGKALLQSDKKRHIGFALLILQRRMASSTFALFQSLKRRRSKLQHMLEEPNKNKEKQSTESFDIETIEDMDEKERWEKESIWETLSVAENRDELKREIDTLANLISKAQSIITSEHEKKLTQLKDTLTDMNNSNTNEKILIFTESKDTLEYIKKKVRAWGYLANTIHGNMSLEDRVRAETVFKNETQIMIATEAAGEGINLQFCHLMINYDLPWNPNRLEQRMGRVHRYGQQNEVTVFNLVAIDTREGQIMKKLFEKLDEIKAVMKSDKVFDVISEIFPGKSLSQLFIEAAATTRSQEEIIKDLDIVVDHDHMDEMMEKLGDSLVTKYIDYTHIKKLRDRAEENKLIPKYTEELFKKAFEHAGGRLRVRKDGFISIESIPIEIKKIAGEDVFKKSFGTMLSSYSKTTFDKQTAFKNSDSSFITFGHPLFESVLQWIDKSFGNEMQKGATFLDPRGRNGHVIFHEGEIKDGTGTTAGKKLFAHFINLDDNQIIAMDPAIMWDFIESDEKYNESIDVDGVKDLILSHVMTSLEDYNIELKKERSRQAQIKQKYGIESLSQSIRDVDNDLGDLQNRKERGEKVDMAIRNKQQRLETYKDNKAILAKNIREENSLTISTPIFIGIIRIKPTISMNKQNMQNDQEIENIGMSLTIQHEKDAGRIPEDVSKDNLGFDIRSVDADGKDIRYIEVKARAGEGCIEMSRNEWYQASQLGESYYLYVVWNAKSQDPKLIIKQNPAKNLDVKRKEIVRYIVDADEIREQTQ